MEAEAEEVEVEGREGNGEGWTMGVECWCPLGINEFHCRMEKGNGEGWDNGLGAAVCSL